MTLGDWAVLLILVAQLGIVLFAPWLPPSSLRWVWLRNRYTGKPLSSDAAAAWLIFALVAMIIRDLS